MHQLGVVPRRIDNFAHPHLHRCSCRAREIGVSGEFRARWAVREGSERNPVRTTNKPPGFAECHFYSTASNESLIIFATDPCQHFSGSLIQGVQRMLDAALELLCKVGEDFECPEVEIQFLRSLTPQTPAECR